MCVKEYISRINKQLDTIKKWNDMKSDKERQAKRITFVLPTAE